MINMKNVLHILDRHDGHEISAIKFDSRLRPFVTLVPNSRRLFLGTTDGEVLHVQLNF